MISDATLRRLLRSDSLVALTGDLVRGLLALGVLTVAAYWLAYDAALAHMMFRDLHMNDFGKFYYSARAFLDGADMYAPSPATAIPIGPGETGQFANMNPPHFHLLLLPLARLSPLHAVAIWAAASLAALIASLRLIARELGLAWTLKGTVWTIVAIIVCSATGTLLVTGQVTFLLMLPLTLAWAAARRDRWPRAGIWLGAAASVKPFLGLFWIYLLVTRRKKAAASMALAAASCALVGLAVFGWDAHVRWLRALTRVDWAWSPMNGSIGGLVARGLAVNPFFTPLVEAPRWVAPLTTALALSLALVATIALARDRSRQASDRAFFILVLTSLLVSPLGWVYYLWLAAGPTAALWLTRGRRPSHWRDGLLLLALPGLLCPLQATMAWGAHPLGGVTLGSIYTWTMLALWGGALCDWLVRAAATSPARNSRPRS